MADVDVKKQQNTETGNQQKGLEKRESRGVSRNRGWDPFSFSLMPSDFFGTDPFSFMRRMRLCLRSTARKSPLKWPCRSVPFGRCTD